MAPVSPTPLPKKQRKYNLRRLKGSTISGGSGKSSGGLGKSSGGSGKSSGGSGKKSRKSSTTTTTTTTLLSPAEINQNLQDIEEIMAPVSPPPPKKRKMKINVQ